MNNFNLKQKIIATGLPFLLFFLGGMGIYLTHRYYCDAVNLNLKNQATISANEISNTTKLFIENKVNILKTIANPHPHIFPAEYQHYIQLASSIIENVNGFKSINWISPDGVILWVYPEEANKNAKNKKVIDRPDVRDYLIQAKETRQATLTHLVLTYQGYEGFALYVPIYEKAEFKGWLNGVVEYKPLFDAIFESENYKHSKITLSWKNHSDSIYVFKGKSESNHQYIGRTEFQVLNQTIEVEAKFSHLKKNERDIFIAKIIFIIFNILNLTLSLLIYKLIQNYYLIIAQNNKVKLDNTIINILCHDIATPLTVISECAQKLKEKIPGTFYELERIIKSTQKQKELLKRIKLYHAADIGILRLDLKEENLKEIVFETLSIYDEQIQSKEIQIELKISDDTPPVITDKITLVHNVLSNVLSNAIKFAPHGSKLLIQTREVPAYIILEFIDEGIGIGESQLRKLFDEKYVTSREGTQGERGTGLGMIQIKSFMTAYKGHIEITSKTIDEFPNNHGTCIKLCFRKPDQLNRSVQ